MKIAIPDDYQDAVRGLDCFPKLAGHSVSIFTDTVTDLDALAARLGPAEALVLIRERTRITAHEVSCLASLSRCRASLSSRGRRGVLPTRIRDTIKATKLLGEGPW